MNAFQRMVIGLFLMGALFLAWGCAGSPFETFVVSTESRKLTVLNLDEDKDLLEVEGSPFDLGAGACDVTYDARHRRIYVANREEDTLSVFQVKRVTEDLFHSHYVLEPKDPIATAHEPMAVSADSRQNMVLILHRDGTLRRLNGKDLTTEDETRVMDSITAQARAVDLAYDARNDLIYVIDEAVHGLLVLRAASLEPVHFVSTPSRPCTLCYDDVNDRIYVTYRGEEIDQELPGLAVYQAGPFCSPLRDPIPLGVPFRCPDVAYDAMHNRIIVNKPNLRVLDGDSFEMIEEIQTSLPYALDTGLVDGSSPLLLYIGQPGSVRIHEIPSGNTHPYVTQVPLAGQGDAIAAVRPGCPEIVSLEPSQGKVGDTVTILGLNFKEAQERSIVSFGGSPASADDVISWADTQIDVKVPALARSGPVRVIVGNRSSAPPDGEDVRAFEVIPGQYIHVSARDGSYGGDGSEGDPYRTITRALSMAHASDVVCVHAGRYNRELGEQFPLKIGDGVRVEGYYQGDYDVPVYSFEILYSKPGDGAVEMGKGASLVHVGVYVEDPGSGDGDSARGIICRKSARIEDVVVAGFRTGILLEGIYQSEIEPIVNDADISSCVTGIYVCGSVNAEIIDNCIFENQVGIDMLGNTNRVIANDMDNNTRYGIKIQGQAAFLFSNWVRRTSNPESGSDGHGLWGATQTHTFIRGNMILDNDEGISINADPGYLHFLRENTAEGNRRAGLNLAGNGFFEVLMNNLRSNQESGIMLRARDSFLKGNRFSYNGDGLLIYSMTELESLLEDNMFYGNTGAGVAVLGDPDDMGQNVVVRIGRPDLTGNTFSNNERGVYVNNALVSMYKNTIEENQTGVFATQNGFVFLGSENTPGGNIIQGNTHVGLANRSDRRIHAPGNTWNPSVQGADAEGHYPENLVAGPVPPQDGNNYSISSSNGRIQF